MNKETRITGGLIWIYRAISMALISACTLTVSAQASHSAEIFKCSAWTNSSLSHRGEVTVALDINVLTWRADAASSTAEVIRVDNGTAAYFDEAFIYLVFGALFLEFEGIVDAHSGPVVIRRIPFVQSNPRVSEIECR